MSSAAVEDEDAVADAEDDVHVVLGEQDGEAAAGGEAPGEGHELGAFGGRHAGGGLVHQEEAGLVGEGDGEFEALQVAVGQHAGAAGGLVAEADLVEELVGFGHEQGAGGAPALGETAGGGDEGHLDVLADGHAGEARGDLEGAADAAAPDGAGRQAGDGPASQGHGPGVRPELAADHVEAGGLAGAVGADEGEHLAGCDGEGDGLDGGDATPGFAEVFDGEDAHAARRVQRRWAAPAIPAGNSTTSRTMAAPRAARQRSVARRRAS